MAMHNPPHPGEFITEGYFGPNRVSCRAPATPLGVSASTLNRVLNGARGLSPAMALRLSHALGRYPESRLAMQANYDPWHAKRSVKLDKIGKIKLSAV